MIKKWKDWLHESSTTDFSCYGMKTISLREYMLSENLSALIENAIKDIRDNPEDVDDYDVEIYTQKLKKDFKNIIKCISCSMNDAYLLYFSTKDGEHYYPSDGSGNFSLNYEDDFSLALVNQSINAMTGRGTTNYPSRDIETDWISARLFKPNKNDQTHFVFVHLPWDEDDKNDIVIAKKETFEIMEILSSVSYKTAEKMMETDLLNRITPAKLRMDLKASISSKKYGL